MVELVDSLNLTTNVELLDGLVQVLDSRVLGIATKDKLSLLGPRYRGNYPRQRDPQKKGPAPGPGIA